MRYFHLLLVSLVSFVLVSCSEMSMEDEARRAAELSIQSNQYSMDNDLDAAGATYKEVQDIMDKYKQLNKFDEFYKYYLGFLQENAYRLDEKAVKDAEAIDESSK